MWVASDKGDFPIHEAAMARHNGRQYRYIALSMRLSCFYSMLTLSFSSTKSFMK